MRNGLLFIALLVPMSLSGKEFTAGGPKLGTEEVTCHLPEREHLANAAGHDGFGLCVFTSLELAAKWSNEPALWGFRDFMTKHPGGGWPEKVDQFIPKMSASKGLPTPGWVQHTGGDAAFLRHALANGRYVCVTYDGRDGVFYRQRIAHMVNLVHLSERYAVIQDNNFPGQWLWMTPSDFLDRWRGTGGGWAIALTKPGPPPIPTNAPAPKTPMLQYAQPKPLAGISEGDQLNYGVVVQALTTAPTYRINGQPANREAALAAVGNVPDDANKAHLTIVGSPELRQQVLHDFATHPALAEWRTRLIIQDYAPDHWAVVDVGFAPGITLQPAAKAQGKAPVLFRLSTYKGAEFLAEVLRKADPNYRPERDPDPTRTEPPKVEPPKTDPAKADPPSASVFGVPPWLWWGGIGAAIGWGLRRVPLPRFTMVPKRPDLRTTIVAVLADLLRSPTPPKPSVEDDIRQRLHELLHHDPKS